VGLSSKSIQKEIDTLNSIIKNKGAIVKSESKKSLSIHYFRSRWVWKFLKNWM